MEEILREDENNIQIATTQTVNVADENTQTETNKKDLNSVLDIPMGCVRFSSELGHGKFGRVFMAKIKGFEGDVAVKTLKGIYFIYKHTSAVLFFLKNFG